MEMSWNESFGNYYWYEAKRTIEEAFQPNRKGLGKWFRFLFEFTNFIFNRNFKINEYLRFDFSPHTFVVVNRSVRTKWNQNSVQVLLSHKYQLQEILLWLTKQWFFLELIILWVNKSPLRRFVRFSFLNTLLVGNQMGVLSNNNKHPLNWLVFLRPTSRELWRESLWEGR